MRQRKDDLSKAIRAHRTLVFWRAQNMADHRARLAFEREQAQAERELKDFWRRVRRKLPRQRIAPLTDNRESRRAVRATVVRELKSLPAYRGPLLDRRGRRGVFVAVRYLSAKTATIGCARRLVYYIVHPDHIEPAEVGQDVWHSNVGNTAGEVASAFDLLEDLNRAARSNAKVVFHIIVQLPFDVTTEERLRILKTWCELAFGSRDLPYVVALHEPSAEGDQRNFHGHVAFSTRPMVHREAFGWDVGRELKRDCDSAKAFRAMRHDFAAVMTTVSQLAGKDREYTGLSNAERGMKAKPTTHSGSHKTRLARRGTHVPEVERNRARIARNEALMEADRLKHRTESLGARVRKIRAMASRIVTPVKLAERPIGVGSARLQGPSSRATPQRQAITVTPVAQSVRPLWHPVTIAPVDRGDRLPIEVRKAAIAAIVPIRPSNTKGFRRASSTPLVIASGTAPFFRAKALVPPPSRRDVQNPEPTVRPHGSLDQLVAVPQADRPSRSIDGPVAVNVRNTSTVAPLPRATISCADPPNSAPATRNSALPPGIATAPTIRAQSRWAGMAARPAALPTPALHVTMLAERPSVTSIPKAILASADRPMPTPTIISRHPSAGLSAAAAERRRRAKRRLQALLAADPVDRDAAQIGAVSSVPSAAFGAPARSLLARAARINWGRDGGAETSLDETPLLDATPLISSAPITAKPRPAPQIADGFGGWRDTPAPSFTWRDTGGVQAKAFGANGRPSRPLLTLLEFAGRQPHRLLFADDKRLMAGEAAPPMIASLVQSWRHDDAVEALVVHTVRESRAAGRPVWPPEVAAAVRALAGPADRSGNRPLPNERGREPT